MEKKTMCVAGAMKYLKLLGDNKDSLIRKEIEGSVYDELNGERQSCAEYSLADTQRELELLDQSVLNIRHAVNVSNSTSIVGDTGLTVDQVLISMAQLNARLYQLQDMALKPVRSRPRPFSPGSSDKIVVCANYDPVEAKTMATEIREKVSKLQMALDMHNLSTEISFESV